MKPIHLHYILRNPRTFFLTFVFAYAMTFDLRGQEEFPCCTPFIPPLYEVDENHWDEPTSFWQNGGHIPKNTVNDDTTDYARAHIKETGSATLRVFDSDSESVYPAGEFVGFYVKSPAFPDSIFEGVTISTYLDGTLVESRTGEELMIEYIPFYVNDPICIGFISEQAWNQIEVKFDAAGGRFHYDVFYAVIGEECPPDTSSLPPLAVTWLGFEVKAKGDIAELNWSTAQEYNNSQFEIERSADGLNFKMIGEVNSLTLNEEGNTYTFLDTNPLKGPNFYRIKQVDYDGKFGYSVIRSISIAKSGLSIKSWPNPAVEILNMEIPDEISVSGEIKLINATGIVVLNKLYDHAGYHTSLDISEVEPGFYSLVIQSGGQRHVERVVVLK